MPVTLSTQKPPVASAYYKIGQFGIETVSIREDYGVYYYPTAADRHEPGIFTVNMTYSAAGDFNGDGFQDAIVSWAVYPHTVPHQATIRPAIYLNDGHGGLRLATAAEVETIPVVAKGQRFAVGDLNGDGVDDIVQASEGLNQRNADGTYTTKYDPIVMLLSASGGKLVNGTARIQGQEGGGPAAGYTVGHEISLGDVDGDGDLDIFSGKILLLNDGKANFTNAANALPAAVRPSSTILTASAMGDFDKDGKADIFAAYLDGTQYVALSRWNGTEAGWQVAAAPAPLFGANTKPNDAAVADVNGDGWLDIIVGATRADPYYQGAGLQILINKGQGQFVDETAARIDNAPRDKWHGEGQLDLVDIDGDGDIDLIHSTDWTYDSAGKITGGGVAVAVNNGKGVFTWLPQSTFTDVKTFQLTGGESSEPFQQRDYLARLFPIDIDKSGGVDFIGTVQTPFTRWPTTEPSEFTSYTVLNTAAAPGMSLAALSQATPAILRQTDAVLTSELSAKVSAGSLTTQAAVNELVKIAGATTSVATLSYQFFTGKIPGLAGVDYLVSPTGPNANNLNSAFYQSFSLENRYINFAVNLGKVGEGNAKFTVEYGALSLFDATKKAYATIFGVTPTDDKVHALLDPSFTLAGKTMTRAEYFASYGGDGSTGIGTKAAMVGWLLGEAVKADVGMYAKANDAFLTDLADGATFAVDLVGVYGKPEFAVF
ncbi:MAG TPA: FG-GAP-like repeat-containing protein [Caulobacter sp.]|nr:FG-GAP-like repeat-containing protein [Caulobacter sp.]